MGRPILIYGAGIAGQMTLKEIETNQDIGMAVIGFIDDSPRLHKRKIHGYPVFGGMEELSGVIEKHGIKEVIVSFKQSGAEKKKEVKSMCQKRGYEVDVSQMKLIIK